MEDRLTDSLHEAAKPLARYRDDEDLDAMLKQEERDGDPMAAFLNKKKKKNPKFKGVSLLAEIWNLISGYFRSCAMNNPHHTFKPRLG